MQTTTINPPDDADECIDWTIRLSEGAAENLVSAARAAASKHVKPLPKMSGIPAFSAPERSALILLLHACEKAFAMHPHTTENDFIDVVKRLRLAEYEADEFDTIHLWEDIRDIASERVNALADEREKHAQEDDWS